MNVKAKKMIGFTGLGILGLLVFLAMQGNVVSSPSVPSAVSPGLPLEVSAEETHAAWEQGATILDVRELSELQAWGAGHIPGAILIPLDQLENRMGEIPQDRPVYVVCGSGQRSATARDLLLNAGFTGVTSMAGGMEQWNQQGYEVVSRP